MNEDRKAGRAASTSDRAALGMTPPEAIGLSVAEVVSELKNRLPSDAVGDVDEILAGTRNEPSNLGNLRHSDTTWIRRANIVGINVRTIGSLWHVVNYSLTLPRAVDAIHLLPVWEPGVVASLYGMASWQLNDEFFDCDLYAAHPALADVGRQLRAVVALLHLDGRSVGIDVVPHTDRFSEIVLANPSYFEWLRREGASLVDHRSILSEEVESLLVEYLREEGPALPEPLLCPEELFSASVSETRRTRLLFGSPEDREGRNARREQIIDRLYERGLETTPATMGPPYRGLRVDPDKKTVDDKGRAWYDYAFLDPQPASRAFGPLTRYAFFERKDNNRTWQIDFSRPRHEVFSYLAGHIAEFATAYGFDFMRGDMSHVQMRPEGVPRRVDDYYDPLGYVKRYVGRETPGFAYFAESFLAPPGTMAYGDEVDHLEASDAEATLGDLQSVPIHEEAFLQRLRRYRDIAETRSVTPCFTVMTGDKDDPRFDSFYLRGNELRAFCAYFLTDMPSYTALGFELRDGHEKPAANEYYTKLYVFHEERGAKATNGPYRFGENLDLFEKLQRIRRIADENLPSCRASSVHWLLPPDAKGNNKVLAWWLGREPDVETASLLCVANTDTEHLSPRLILPPPPRISTLPTLAFATDRAESVVDSVVLPGSKAVRFMLGPLPPGACRLYTWPHGSE